MFELQCKHVGFDCPAVIHGATREVVLAQAAARAKEAHQTVVTPEMAVKVATLIREA